MTITKIGLRRIWFQAHKWIGLVLAVLIVPLCLSGAALVWQDALDKALNPHRYAVTSPVPKRTPEAYVAAARGVLAPGERIANLRVERDGPVIVTAVRPQKEKAHGRPSRTLVWLDPGNARVLDKADGQAGFLRVMHQLHGSMMIPGVGRSVVGWLGVAMLLSSVTGLWLWWPTAGAWTRGLRWRRHRNFDTNLHHQFGFWIALPLFVLSLTGAWISFPAFFGALSGQQPLVQGGEARFRARPLESSALGLDVALARAQEAAPGSLAAVAWPTDRKRAWAVTLKPSAGKPTTVLVDDATGTARVDADRGERRGGLARTMRKIHQGTDMGIVWQVVIFLGGILPAVLTITGVIMWWRARGWRAELAARRGLNSKGRHDGCGVEL